MALADMAQQLSFGEQGPFRLSEIAARQEISLNYLEQIFGALRRAGLVESQRGAHGGYRLARGAEQIHIGDVIVAVDDPIEVTPCRNGKCQNKQGCCLTRDLWADLGQHIRSFLNGVSLDDIVAGRPVLAPEPLFCEQVAAIKSAGASQ